MLRNTWIDVVLWIRCSSILLPAVLWCDVNKKKRNLIKSSLQKRINGCRRRREHSANVFTDRSACAAEFLYSMSLFSIRPGSTCRTHRIITSHVESVLNLNAFVAKCSSILLRPPSIWRLFLYCNKRKKKSGKMSNLMTWETEKSPKCSSITLHTKITLAFVCQNTFTLTPNSKSVFLILFSLHCFTPFTIWRTYRYCGQTTVAQDLNIVATIFEWVLSPEKKKMDTLNLQY